MLISSGVVSGFHAGMHGGSLLILFAVWAVVGIYMLIVKVIVASQYPEDKIDEENIQQQEDVYPFNRSSNDHK